MADEMSPEEIRIATKGALINMRKNVREWSIRDTLCELTEFGFWPGGSFIILDEDTSHQVIDSALEVVSSEPDQVVNDIYEVVHHFEPLKG